MMEFYIKNESTGEDILFPVPPEGYDTETGIDIETVRAAEVGDINIPGYRKPNSITLEGFFPDKKYSFGFIPLKRAREYVLLLERWCRQKEIVRLIIADDKGARVNEKFYIEYIRSGEHQSDNGDIVFKISLRQYTPLEAVTTENQQENKQRQSDKPPQPPKIHIVQKGESLWAISRQVYGDGAQWKKIYNANQNVIGKNPNMIFPGQKLRIIP